MNQKPDNAGEGKVLDPVMQALKDLRSPAYRRALEHDAGCTHQRDLAEQGRCMCRACIEERADALLISKIEQARCQVCGNPEFAWVGEKVTCLSCVADQNQAAKEELKKAREDLIRLGLADQGPTSVSELFAQALDRFQHAAGNVPYMTPAAHWQRAQEKDPHADRYECERSTLALGHLSDDELANAVYMIGDRPRPSPKELLEGALLPAVYLTAAKDRIRWLSRLVVKLIDEKTLDQFKVAKSDADWTGTSEQINALPPNLRRWVMWLQTEADPAGTIRENFRLTQENAALRVLIENSEVEGRAGFVG